MATRYVDGAVAVSGNGTISSPWKAIANITGLAAGDTVYFSGGASGLSYTSSSWTPPAGTSGNPITYAVWPDAGKNGMVTFAGSGNEWLAGNVHDIVFDGRIGSAQRMTSTGHAFTIYNATMGQVQRITFFGFQMRELWRTDGCTGLEYAYNDAIMPVSEVNDLFFRIGYTSGASHTSNLIHHNTLQVWRIRSSGFGQDCFKWIGSASIYNNTIRSLYSASYTGNQHNDGIQTDESNVWVYDNYFEGFISYPIYNEMYGNCSGWRIYNNVINNNVADAGSIDWNAHQSMALGGSSAGTISDYIVANNTCVGSGLRGTGSHGALGIHFNTGVPMTVGSGCYLVNNLFYNLDDALLYNGNPTVSNNTDAGTSGRGFVNNAVYPNNNFRLTASATAAINQGISPSYLTNVFTTDADGYQRNVNNNLPALGAWDIGAYEYGASGGGTPPTGTITLSVR